MSDLKAIGCSPATSQTLMAGSEAPAEISRRLSGLKVTAGTGVEVGLKG